MAPSKRKVSLFFDERAQQWMLIIYAGNIAQHVPLTKALREWDIKEAEAEARRQLRNYGIRTVVKATKQVSDG